MPNILAFTAESQGKQVLFSCNDRSNLLTDDWGEAIAYLLKPCDFGVVFGLEHFTELFCSLIPQNVVKELKDKGKAFLPMPSRQKLYYQIGRVFAITWGSGREINLYPLSRYSDIEITDVNGLKELADKVVEAYGYFGLTPTKLTSPVAVFEEVLDGVDYSRACDLPDSALEMLSKCSEVAWEEWREVYKVGHWGANEITDVDLTAGYPSLIAKLPDLREAKFFTSKTIPDRYSWGLLEGTLNLVKDVTPFYFLGEFPALITTGHLRLINKYQWGEFKMDNGWFFSVPKGYRTPFKDTMTNLYQARQNENPLIKNISKAISVGIGGKFVQRYSDGRLGDNWNSIYGKMITSACQCEVADAIWSRNLQERIISILVDGFLVEGEILSDLGLESSSGMGSWRANLPSSFLVASLLYQWDGLDTKHPNKQTYSEVMESIKRNPKSSIIGNDVDLNLLTFGRNFKKLPKCGGDLLKHKYNSEPQRKEIKE